MKELIEQVCSMLEREGWIVIEQETPSEGLPAHIRERYPKLPPEWVEFATRCGVCINAEDNGWFLCANDYEERENDNAFSWNEFEQISLRAAREDQDPAWEASIRRFWDKHLPIYLSVAEYEYYALRTEDGAVVHGLEPEFEEATEIAPSFRRFLEMIRDGEIVFAL